MKCSVPVRAMSKLQCGWASPLSPGPIGILWPKLLHLQPLKAAACKLHTGNDPWHAVTSKSWPQAAWETQPWPKLTVPATIPQTVPEYQSTPCSGPGHAVQMYPHAPIFICCLPAACKTEQLRSSQIPFILQFIPLEFSHKHRFPNASFYFYKTN